MGKPKLYLFELSPATRTVLLTAKAINLDLEHVILNTLTGETKSPEFMKINPQHTVPTLDDNGDIVIESGAIAVYLVSKFGGTKYASLVPTDPYLRAKVDHRLFYSDGTLFYRFGQLLLTIVRTGAAGEEALKSALEGLDFLEEFLKAGDYVAGNDLTVADFACVAMATNILGMIPYDSDRYPRLLAWMGRMAKLPYYDGIITNNLKIFDEFIFNKIGYRKK